MSTPSSQCHKRKQESMGGNYSHLSGRRGDSMGRAWGVLSRILLSNGEALGDAHSPTTVRMLCVSLLTTLGIAPHEVP